MNKKKNIEIRIIFTLLCVLFIGFLIAPLIMLFLRSFQDSSGAVWANYVEMLSKKGFGKAVLNSFLVASCSAILTTTVAFFLAYTVNYTNVHPIWKKIIKTVAVFPMLLPTITYGFAIIYSFGKQGLITKLFGKQLFEIYGFKGLLLGFSVYTLPISFLLIQNTMGYIDKKFMVVSRIMGDSGTKTFWMTILRPLLGTLAASFVQCFTLSFTDYGIPASVGGKFDVVATVLYNEMLGSVPNFNQGAVVAVVMLIPSVINIFILRYLEKYNIRYNKISPVENFPNKTKDIFCTIGSGIVLVIVLSIFLVIFVVPFVEEWPYRTGFSLNHIRAVLDDMSLLGVYKNSIEVALLTATAGTLIAYGGALVTARSNINKGCKKAVESIAMVTNTVPGMVIGIAFLLVYSGTPLQNTIGILVLCNVVHFFSTPFLMMKSSLEKMNASWETTAMLMGDSWLKTIVRVVTPNAVSTIIEVFCYYFVNAMVTVSAVIFIAGARTMVITTKIKELQHFSKYNEIFVLSLFILLTNIIAKALFGVIAKKRNQRKEN